VTAGDTPRYGLKLGERILIHSRGDPGRTGIIATRLLVGWGEVPGETLQRLRAAETWYARHGHELMG